MEENKWRDISVTIRPGMVHWPGDPPFVIRRMQNMDKGDVDNVSLLSMGTHTGTHMDAPRHFFARGRSIDTMPLDVSTGAARVIALKDTPCVTAGDIRKHRIRSGERILFKTKNSSFWTAKDFKRDFVYISEEAAVCLSEAGVRLVGIDYLSVGGYQTDGVKTHRILLGAGIWLIEGLNLSGVKAGNYELVCLPLKIMNADGAPARAILRMKK